MMKIRRAEDRGHAQHGWLDSQHTFSFADYYNPAQMGFRALRVLNEDRVQPGAGFPTHPHRDMEILSYVLEGALAHKDSLGTGSTIRPGDVQRMSAGTGVTHSEFNASSVEPVHFLQIWLLPERPGLPPSYQQTHFEASARQGRLTLVASQKGDDGSLTIHQDVRVYSGRLDSGEQAELTLAPGRHAWVQVARGTLKVIGQTLRAGDGAALSEEPHLLLDAGQQSEVLVFDLA
ncbi:MAG: pirin family protein [Myxococcaceae bacterium]